MMDNLKKRHVPVIEWCNTCKRSGESIDHCDIASALWSGFFRWVIPGRIEELFYLGEDQVGAHKLQQYERWPLFASSDAPIEKKKKLPHLM